MSQVKILFLAANPLDSTRLSLDEEVRIIEEKLRASKHRDSIVLKTWWAVQPDDLLQALNEELPHIVHFSGHGSGAGGLIFHNELGKTHLISGAALKRLFCILKGNIRVVVLNACYSHDQAKAIADCVDCVIGMNDSIDDKVCRKFTASFYRAIAFGRSVQNAFDQGLASIAFETLEQEDFPQLLAREGIDANNIFLIEDGPLDVDEDQPVLSEKEIQNIKKKVPNTRMQKAHGDHFLRHTLPGLAGKIRYKEDLSIIILDIDQLTIINKQYGRHVGNNVIAAIAHILFVEAGVEYSGRCGDDTYYVLLPGHDINKAENLAEHLSRCIEHHPWASLASNLRVTCSFGVSQLRRQEPIRDWVIRAGVALNTAKVNVSLGKVNRVDSIDEDKGKPSYSEKKYGPGFRYSRSIRVVAAPLYLANNESREFRDYWS